MTADRADIVQAFFEAKNRYREARLEAERQVSQAQEAMMEEMRDLARDLRSWIGRRAMVQQGSCTHFVDVLGNASQHEFLLDRFWGKVVDAGVCVRQPYHDLYLDIAAEGGWFKREFEPEAAPVRPSRVYRLRFQTNALRLLEPDETPAIDCPIAKLADRG